MRPCRAAWRDKAVFHVAGSPCGQGGGRKHPYVKLAVIYRGGAVLAATSLGYGDK
jgi:hypothetical protein